MDQNAKQLAVERIKNSANILVTVSANPGVDDLAALIGFTLLLSKLNKHASAVFSGNVPPAIEFLQPDARLEKDVSSLRDFIIALDKNKADKLRYKVEENVVKIFITPYKSRISQDDLTFSEGDFNVDTIVALGVSKRDDLDNAIKSHGRILHDAAVITVNAGAKTSDLGAIDWQDPSASSLCEMLVSISESFGSGLLDEQISTAFLTGIVAATDRFSNNRTSPKVMTMAAQLMAAGANQQLISNNLTPTAPQQATPPPVDDSQLSIDHGEHNEPPKPSEEVDLKLPMQPASQAPTPPPEPKKAGPKDTGPGKPPAKPPKNRPPDKSIKQLEEEIAKMASSAESKKKQLLPQSPETKSGAAEKSESQPQEPKIGHSKGHGPREVDEDPLLGGTFNATSQQAHDESVSDLRKSVNSTLLNHPRKPLDESEEPEMDRPAAKAPTVQPLTMSSLPPQPPAGQSMPVAEAVPSPALPPQPPPPAGLNVDEARKEVEAAVNAQPFDSANNPLESINAQALPAEGASGQEISIDSSGNLQQPGQTTAPPAGDTTQEFKLPN